MRKTVVLGIVLLVTSAVVLGGTVFRQQVADASGMLNVFVTNDSSQPVPVREQNTDASGNIKVHEQDTANVNVTNPSLTVAPEAPITAGGAGIPLGGGSIDSISPAIASALSIHLTSGIDFVFFNFQGHHVADFLGPIEGGNDSIVVALTRPIEFDEIICAGSSSDVCSVSWVGAQP